MRYLYHRRNELTRPARRIRRNSQTRRVKMLDMNRLPEMTAALEALKEGLKAALESDRNGKPINWKPIDAAEDEIRRLQQAARM